MREQIRYSDPVEYVGPLPSLFDLAALTVINTVATLLVSVIVLLWLVRRPWAKPATVALTLAVLAGAAIAGNSIIATSHTALSAMAYVMPVFAMGFAGLLHVFLLHRPTPPASNEHKDDPMTATTIQDTIEGKAL